MRNPYEIEAILEELLQIQSQENPYYEVGLLPSQRYNRFFAYRRQDDNIFFPAIIAFTLQNLHPILNPHCQALAQKVVDQIVAHYPKYKSPKGRNIYNFYQTHPSRHYPHGFLLSQLKSTILPEDADDTVLVYLTATHSPEEVAALKAELGKYAQPLNGQKPSFPSPHLKDLQPYTTWLGSSDMPLEYSICILCNILYFVKYYNLPFDRHDYDSITLIKRWLDKDAHVHQAFKISVYYPSTPLILYHLTRLMGSFEIPELETLRPKIAQDIRRLLPQTSSMMEKILLSTSLLRLGLHYEVIWNPTIQAELRNYAFFIAPMLIYAKSSLLKPLARSKFTHILYSCYGHNLTLILENKALQANLLAKT